MSQELFNTGDYVSFTRIIRAKKPAGFRTCYETGRAIATPQIPEQVLPQSGAGQVMKNPKQARVDGRTYKVAIVDAGRPLGRVRAILDDAVLTGKQASLFDHGSAGVSMYGTDVKGGA